MRKRAPVITDRELERLVKTITKTVRARVSEVQSDLTKLGFPRFKIKSQLTDAEGITGRAWMGIDIIEISIAWLIKFPRRVLEETVAHEVCHLYVAKYYPNFKMHHGKEFRMLMNMLGLAGETKFDVGVPATKNDRYILAAWGIR